MHASSTATSNHHHADPAGWLPESSQPTYPSAQCRRAEPHYDTDTTRTSGVTRHPPPGGLSSGGTAGQPRTHGQPLGGSAGGCVAGVEGGNGGMNEEGDEGGDEGDWGGGRGGGGRSGQVHGWGTGGRGGYSAADQEAGLGCTC